MTQGLTHERCWRSDWLDEAHECYTAPKCRATQLCFVSLSAVVSNSSIRRMVVAECWPPDHVAMWRIDGVWNSGSPCSGTEAHSRLVPQASLRPTSLLGDPVALPRAPSSNHRAHNKAYPSSRTGNTATLYSRQHHLALLNTNSFNSS